jgi:imidazolonepropionase
MKTTLLYQIQSLLQVEAENDPNLLTPRKGAAMAKVPQIENAFLYLKDGKIADWGQMQDCPASYFEADEKIEASGKMVMPTFIDSHTHLVYAGSREAEFVDKIRGLSYEEIFRRGGGILHSAKKLQAASEEELFEQAWQRLEEIMRLGTGAVEIKSGYGLTTQDELKILRVAQKIKAQSPIAVKITFLGAHAFPREVSRQKYMDMILEEMLPAVAEEKLADYCDVFCDKGFFTPQETETILIKASDLGLQLRLHANELDYSGGVQVGVKYGAVSVDHLEFVGEAEIEALQKSQTLPTLLPSTAFFLRLPYAPARKLLEANLPIVLASDYNPGSSPSGNLPFVMSLACIQMKMLPEEALNALTYNAAFALGLEKSQGVIRKGAEANFILTKKVPSLAFLPYSFGSDWIEQVFIKGKAIRQTL